MIETILEYLFECYFKILKDLVIHEFHKNPIRILKNPIRIPKESYKNLKYKSYSNNLLAF